jgi:hypothetical protein
MIPMDFAIVSLATNTELAPHSALTCQSEFCDPIQLRSSHNRLAGGKDDIVITPGGPRPRDQVRPVRPGEAVRQNQDGTYTIMPKNGSAGPGPKDKDKKNAN